MRRHEIQAWKPAFTAGAVAAGVTCAVAVSPRLSFAYAYPQLHTILETAEA